MKVSEAEAAKAVAWLAENGQDRLYVKRRSAITETGDTVTRLNIDMLRARADMLFAHAVALALGKWTVDNSVDVLVSATMVGNKYLGNAEQVMPGLQVVRLRPNPADEAGESWEFTRPGGTTTREVLRSGGTFGLFTHELVTGKRLLKLAEGVPFPADSCLKALAIVDRGQDVPGVKTVAEAEAYGSDNPFEPPAHVALPFACDSIIAYPLPLFERAGVGRAGATVRPRPT